jgi:hypothetical protein
MARPAPAKTATETKVVSLRLPLVVADQLAANERRVKSMLECGLWRALELPSRGSMVVIPPGQSAPRRALFVCALDSSDCDLLPKLDALLAKGAQQ